MRLLAALVVVVAACGPRHVSPSPLNGLTTFRSTTGAYSIDLPPCVDGSPMETGPQVLDGHTVHVLRCDPPHGSALRIYAVTLAAPLSETDVLRLADSYVDEWKRAHGASPWRDISVGSRRGQEITWRAEEREHVAHVVWNERVLVVAVALSINTNPRARTSLDSLRLLR